MLTNRGARSMRKLLLLPLLSCATVLLAQGDLPHVLDASEQHLIPGYRASRADPDRGITSFPSFTPRTMAEWEEVQMLCVTWTSFPSILKQIVRYAKEECEVLIICTSSGSSSQASITTYLNTANAGGPPLSDLNDISFLVAPFNSIWHRDYGAESMYQNEVDSLFLMDWIYNRPRPNDDVLPDAIGALKGIAVFNSTTAPNDLVHTGGNFMADGFGTAFSSELVDMENGASGQYNQTTHTPAQVNTLMTQWMGIAPGRYIKMDVLPYDAIHHIDMHMKLLDEETLLVGEFPTGVSDGPQIEANLAYVQSNFNSVFGTPYKIVRVVMPPSTGGAYAPNTSYRTYTNSIFINKTILVPTYREQYDTTALRIYREALPGYRVVGIDCDESSGNIIAQSGALHCIAKCIGVAQPLLIRHQPLDDVTWNGAGHTVTAYLRHRSGIASAQVYWTTDTAAGFTHSVAMASIGGNEWSAQIPAQPGGSTIFYYVRAVANSGKVQVRPIVAPEGWWKFKVLPAPGLPLAMKLFLEGPYDQGTGLMKDDLRAAGLIPLTEPFTAAGFTLVGGGGETTNAGVLATTGGDAVVDWVLLEARDGGDPASILRTCAALVQRDGDVVGTDGTSNVLLALPAGSYHLAVRQMNHLGCMTAGPVALSSLPASIDLTVGTTATWGTDARKVIGGAQVLWAGNVVRDGTLKYTGTENDRDDILVKIGGAVPTSTVAGYWPEDVNRDGVVKYTGIANDRDPILVNIGGAVPTSTRVEQLP